MKKIVCIAALLVLLLACKNGPQIMTNVSGKAREIVVVADKNYWDTDFGAAIREVLGAEHPALPQPEPLFNLVNISQASFTQIFEPHRNLLLLRISPQQTEAKMDIRHDVYAAPQLVVILSGPNGESVAALVREQGDKLKELYEQAERSRVIENAKKYQEVNVRAAVMDVFGGSPYFPVGYTVRKKADHFIWIAYDSKPAIQGVLVFSYPYTGAKDFEVANMVAAENKILKAEVPSSADGSYMAISSIMTPEMNFLKYNDIHLAEMRGLWMVENGFMGGPFVSHSFLDKEGKNVIVLLAFVYAPSREKRNFMRQTEALLYSFEWAEKEKEQTP